MLLPAVPPVRPVQQVSPTLYEALLRCLARGAWVAWGDRSVVPHHPKAILGICLHAVVEEAHKGGLLGEDGEARLAAARQAFDQRAALSYREAHPLLRAKFRSPERLPYYNLFRERAALEAAASAKRVMPGAAAASTTPGSMADLHVERRLVSRDKLLLGRPDLIDAAAGEVVDYKTGTFLEESANGISAAEERQLRLYVHLAHENGLAVSRAVIARADGRRASIEVSRDEAEGEGKKARELLAQYNAATGTSFRDAAQPSPEGCRFCPCIPFCEAFWQAAAPSWIDQCGAHLEGAIQSINEATVQGVRLMSLRVRVERGTVAAEEAVVEQVPVAWTTCDGSPAPQKGNVVRIVYAYRPGEGLPARIRVDRAHTSVWTMPGPGTSSGG